MSGPEMFANPGTLIKDCRSAELYMFEDGCQAQQWLRCAICGAHESQTCALNEDTVAYKYLNATQQQEDRVKKVNDALAFGRWYAKQMVTAERAKQQAALPPVPETDTPCLIKAWRIFSTIIALVVISQWISSMFS